MILMTSKNLHEIVSRYDSGLDGMLSQAIESKEFGGKDGFQKICMIKIVDKDSESLTLAVGSKVKRVTVSQDVLKGCEKDTWVWYYYNELKDAYVLPKLAEDFVHFHAEPLIADLGKQAERIKLQYIDYLRQSIKRSSESSMSSLGNQFLDWVKSVHEPQTTYEEQLYVALAVKINVFGMYFHRTRTFIHRTHPEIDVDSDLVFELIRDLARTFHVPFAAALVVVSYYQMGLPGPYRMLYNPEGFH